KSCASPERSPNETADCTGRARVLSVRAGSGIPDAPGAYRGALAAERQCRHHRAHGSAAVAKSPADGYTLLLGSTGTITAGPAVFKTLPYDPVKDFVAVGGIQS